MFTILFNGSHGLMTRPNKHSFMNRMNLQTTNKPKVGAGMCNPANLNTAFQNGVC